MIVEVLPKDFPKSSTRDFEKGGARKEGVVSDLLKMTKVLTLNVIRKITEATVFVEILPKDVPKVLHKISGDGNKRCGVAR